MKNIKSYFIFLATGLSSILFILPSKALAVCPVCTVAVGAGVGFSRWLGIDDTITGLWIGGLIVSLIIWTENWFNKKNIQFKARITIITLAYYLLIIIPLYFAGILGNPQNSLLCFYLYVDRLLLGIIVGSLVFLFSVILHLYLKEKNNNRSYFPFQKVIMPILLLIILSIIFYFLTK